MLPDSVDVASVTAHNENGTLTVRIPIPETSTGASRFALLAFDPQHGVDNLEMEIDGGIDVRQVDLNDQGCVVPVDVGVGPPAEASEPRSSTDMVKQRLHLLLELGERTERLPFRHGLTSPRVEDSIAGRSAPSL